MDWRRNAEIQADVVYFPCEPVAELREATEVFVWDLDKTYLDTKFETFGGLLRAAFEKPFQKRNLPGTAVLVRALQETWREKNPGRVFPIFFITASPPQIQDRILEKLHLDGLRPIGLFFKDNMQNLRPRRLWRLTQQVGYKLQALLQMRQLLGSEVRQVLFGDDSESDATVYSLYSDVCARRLERQQIQSVLRSLRVMGEQTQAILDLQVKVPSNDPVEKIYINLEADTDTDYYLKFGRRTVPTYNSFQLAADLFQDHRLRVEHVALVAQDLITNFGFTTELLAKSLDDLVRRQVLGEPACGALIPYLQNHRILPSDFSTSLAPLAVKQESDGRVIELEGHFEPWVPLHIDYTHEHR